MTELEKRINEVVRDAAPAGKVGQAFSKVKKTLDSSSDIVGAVNRFGDNLQDNIEEGVGGLTGTIGGWMAGKATKLTGGVAGGIVAGTLKTVAGIIPDPSDLKSPETDRKVAHCIDTCALPTGKTELLELLQFIRGSLDSSAVTYGRFAMESFRVLHSRAYSAALIASKDDQDMLKLVKSSAPKKRFGIF